jgi:hypothetical protein
MVINIAGGIRPDGGPVLSALRKLLGFRVSIGEQHKPSDQTAGVDIVVSYLGSIVSWPVLPFADVRMT